MNQPSLFARFEKMLEEKARQKKIDHLYAARNSLVMAYCQLAHVVDIEPAKGSAIRNRIICARDLINIELRSIDKAYH